ncbi:FMN reductase (NADPH) [Bacillus horti]|uniref:FMN reductase (NADPH) n=1 Tax=Caldalkalibacillus horti TaxID=77523 RepID=A0ABT9W4L7_9BACI|nr:FMN reductase (NADPH) [Bacillus horti]
MDSSVHNDIIHKIRQHQSIRKFTSEIVPEEHIRQIVASAQMASTSSNMQAFSIIGVTDKEKKRVLAELAGNQAYIEECSHFLVFCADTHRLKHSAEQEGVDITPALEHVEMFLVSTIDAALAAQNAALASEALGLGIVYIGGIRSRIAEVSEVLNLPDHVYPVFGMCIGYPDQSPGVKPRLPLEAVYFENEYQPFEQVKDKVAAYDQTMSQYYEARTAGKRTDTWSEMMSRSLKDPKRTHLKDFLAERGFLLK